MGKVRFGAPSFGEPCKNDFGYTKKSAVESQKIQLLDHSQSVQIKSSENLLDSFCDFITSCFWKLGEALSFLYHADTHFSDWQAKSEWSNELANKVARYLDTEGQTIAKSIFAKIFNQLNTTQLCNLEGLMNQYENVPRFLLEVDRILGKPRDVLKIAKKMADHPEKAEYIFQKYKPTAHFKYDLQDLHACFEDRQFFDNQLFSTYVDRNLSAASR